MSRAGAAKQNQLYLSRNSVTIVSGIDVICPPVEEIANEWSDYSESAP